MSRKDFVWIFAGFLSVFLIGVKLGQDLPHAPDEPITEAEFKPTISDFEWGRVDGYYRVKPGGPSLYGTDMRSLEVQSKRFDEYLKGYWSGFSERVMEKKD